ncbi:hypothetical protein JAAARDRAFT_194578 [Jaapia argillacea MUCL 33604]|uniref:Uncharacterized protein n=1 Tax=Jaapia argillacea MUCL 33604 TaxID=933084 RepID=A0A067PRX2_9AGAM|nr:hypothetical protein JAAARDRAFT_194578 [Jaapia argillacea MUCL 33604]
MPAQFAQTSRAGATLHSFDSVSPNTKSREVSRDLTNVIDNILSSRSSCVPFPKAASTPTRAVNKATVKPSKVTWKPRPSAPQKRLCEALEEQGTAIISDTTDFETLSIHNFSGSMLTPANLPPMMQCDDLFYHVWVAAKKTIEAGGDTMLEIVENGVEQFLVEVGSVILDRIPGPHVTFIDTRLHEDSIAMVKTAKSLIARFEKQGIHRSRVVITIPATEAGVAAAAQLAKNSIQANLNLVSGLIHAAACAEAGATTITMPVGKIFDWYEKKRGMVYSQMAAHPGIEDIQSTVAYFELNHIGSKLVGSGMRNLAEISHISGLDAVALSQPQIDELRSSRLPLSPTPPDESPVHLRARQAAYPSNWLQSKHGFMSAMSAGARSMLAATLYVALGELKVCMDWIERTLYKEIERQMVMNALPYDVLFAVRTPRKHKRKKRSSPGTPSRSKSRDSPTRTKHQSSRIAPSPLAEGSTTDVELDVDAELEALIREVEEAMAEERVADSAGRPQEIQDEDDVF